MTPVTTQIEDMTAYSNDTIAAIATPPGLGGISIIRISGPQSLAILQKLFKSPRKPFSFIPRSMHYGHILDAQEQPLDEVLAVYMPGPHSATGEDIAEIHCHGGVGVTACILEEILKTGARLAASGEFTRRALLSGRMDLTQAEAVAELISAPTKEGIRLAQAKLAGHLGKKVTGIRESLDRLRIQVTLAVDFPDEEAELLSPSAFQTTIEEALTDMKALVAAFSRARLWREGAAAVLVGAVNAGKSSLFNTLLGRHRAIVSPIAGTTRDYLEETINLQGLPLRILDTAGLRESDDCIEQEGIALSHSLAENADILILVVDASTGLGTEEKDFLQQHDEAIKQGRVVLVINKTDIVDAAIINLPKDVEAFYLSAKTGQGVEAFASALRSLILVKATGASGNGASHDLAPNLRQSILLGKACEELTFLQEDLAQGMPPDILAVRLDAAVHHLHEVTGTTDNEALLDQIFANFCIGK